MPGRLKALLIQPLPEVIGVGRGTAVFVHGRNETDGEDIRALRVTLGEDRPGTEARRAGAEWWATVTTGRLPREKTCANKGWS